MIQIIHEWRGATNFDCISNVRMEREKITLPEAPHDGRRTARGDWGDISNAWADMAPLSS
jgi:hypothetical protein